MGALPIDLDKQIIGSGARTTIIDANGEDRVAHVSAGFTLFHEVTLTGGNASVGDPPDVDLGGAVYVDFDAEVGVVGSVIVGNVAGASGGGIYSLGGLGMFDSTVSGNVSGDLDTPGLGGGIYALWERPALRELDDKRQHGDRRRTGRWPLPPGRVRAIARHDREEHRGGRRRNPHGRHRRPGRGDLRDRHAGGRQHGRGVRRRSRDDRRLGGQRRRRHVVEIGTDGLVGAAAASIAPLGSYGGQTDTHALYTGNPAIDAASECEGVDQRGVLRPQSGPCDAGAYEGNIDPPTNPPPPQDGGGGASQSPATQAQQELPPPEAGETVNVAPESGR